MNRLYVAPFDFLLRKFRNLDKIENLNQVVRSLRDDRDMMATLLMDLVYQQHEPTKLTLALHREIQEKLDRPVGDDLLDISVTHGTTRHSDEHIEWCDMTDRQRVDFYLDGYVVPRQGKGEKA